MRGHRINHYVHNRGVNPYAIGCNPVLGIIDFCGERTSQTFCSKTATSPFPLVMFRNLSPPILYPREVRIF
jgi:hypothetical protein